MPVDHHTHLVEDHVEGQVCFTAEQVRHYADAAEERGLARVGICDHGHRFTAYRKIMRRMFEPEPVAGAAWMARRFRSDLDAYVEAILTVQDEGRPVLLGLEADYVEGHEEAIAQVLDGYPWDYVIGSVHFYEDWAWAASPDEGWDDVDGAYRRYFATLQQSARSGLFDILAHPDLAKKFGHRASFNLEPLYRDTARVLAASGVATELNTAGWWKHRVKEAYPAPSFLRILADEGVPISLGSDAHNAGDIAREFQRATELLAACGIHEVASFQRRTLRR